MEILEIDQNNMSMMKPETELIVNVPLLIYAITWKISHDHASVMANNHTENCSHSHMSVVTKFNSRVKTYSHVNAVSKCTENSSDTRSRDGKFSFTNRIFK
jgi:regulatory protein YycI of two-component signal transduction system YycFG